MWIQIISTIVATLSVVVAGIALRIAFRFESAQLRSAQVATAPELLLADYLKIPLAEPVRIGNARIKTLADARQRPVSYLQAFLDGKDGTQGQWPNFVDKSTRLGTWENTVAYALSLSLQRLGTLTLSGAVAVDVVSPMYAVAILQDWMVCEALVEKIRSADAIVDSRSKKVPFQRRHAEWIALAAALYLSENWTGGSINKLLTMINVDEFRQREQLIREVEGAFVGGESHRAMQRH